MRSSRKPDEKVPDQLVEAEKEVMARLLERDPKLGAQLSIEALYRKVVILERLHTLQTQREQRMKKRQFWETATGAALLTGLLTITASQIPALFQVYSSRMQFDAEVRKTEIELLRPIIESVANDTTLNLDTKLVLVDAIKISYAQNRPVEDAAAEVRQKRGRWR